MKLYINSLDHTLGLPEEYLKVIKKYAKNGNVELLEENGYELAVIEVDSLDILPNFEKDISEARGIVNSFDFADIQGLIFNTIDEQEKIYEITIYDFYNE